MFNEYKIKREGVAQPCNAAIQQFSKQNIATDVCNIKIKFSFRFSMPSAKVWLKESVGTAECVNCGSCGTICCLQRRVFSLYSAADSKSGVNSLTFVHILHTSRRSLSVHAQIES